MVAVVVDMAVEVEVLLVAGTAVVVVDRVDLVVGKVVVVVHKVVVQVAGLYHSEKDYTYLFVCIFMHVLHACPDIK